MERLASLPDTQSTGPDVRAAILAGLTKLLARMPAGASLPAVAEELLQSSVASHSLDLQQRALEALALQQYALPCLVEASSALGYRGPLGARSPVCGMPGAVRGEAECLQPRLLITAVH